MTAPGTTRSVAGPVTTPRELFSTRLRRMLWVELRLAEEVLPRLLVQARATALRFDLGRDLLETRDHAKDAAGRPARARGAGGPGEDPAPSGLVQEYERRVKQVAEEG